MTVFAWLALAAIQGAPEEAPYPLDNGLTVLLRPAEAGERIALVILYSVGGDHDPKGKSGLAHLVEHLYVTAPAGESKARTAQEFFERYGGQANAQTGNRYTVFATVFEPGKLDVELADAAARMKELHFDAELLNRERGRLLDEIHNMFGGIPSLGAVNRAAERMRPTPNGGRKGGLPEHVRSITLDEARAFWKEHYSPRRALLVLAGKFDAKTAREAIAKFFGAIPGGAEIPAPADPGAPQPGLEEAEEKPVVADAKAQVALGFAAPGPDSELYIPWLAAMSRLWRNRGKLGAGPGDDRIRFSPLDDPSFGGIVAPLQGEESAKDAVARLDAFVAEALKTPLDDGDVRSLVNELGPMLGVTRPPEMLIRVNPYFVAFSAGRRLQLGFKDGVSLKSAIEKLKGADFRKLETSVFAPPVRSAVVLRPKK
jgi:zinc protease